MKQFRITKQRDIYYVWKKTWLGWNIVEGTSYTLEEAEKFIYEQCRNWQIIVKEINAIP